LQNLAELAQELAKLEADAIAPAADAANAAVLEVSAFSMYFFFKNIFLIFNYLSCTQVTTAALAVPTLAAAAVMPAVAVKQVGCF